MKAHEGSPKESLQLSLFEFDVPPPSVEHLLTKREDQWFDRKSIRIGAPGLANAMIGFANADGGRIVVGIHDGKIEGVDSSPNKLNELLKAAQSFSEPSVRHAKNFIDSTNQEGNPDRLLILDIEASESIHRNQKGECYLRVGDETRKLGPDEERELVFDKGEAIFDKSIVKDMTLDELDMERIRAYAERVGASDVDRLMRQRGLYVDTPRRKGVSQAGWLLFGLEPPVWSYVRYLRYRGAVAETGTRSNLAEDVRLEGNIPSLIDQAETILEEKVGTVIRLAPSGRFETMPTLPKFAWLEAVVNAVTHRSYSLAGDGVRVLDFDDRLEVHSPGRLPGLVRVQNIRNAPRFSRNPHIARVLAETTGYVRELNEGVKRMFEEMDRFGLRQPDYSVGDGSVRVILYKQPEQARMEWERDIATRLAALSKRMGEGRLKELLSLLKTQEQVRPRDVAERWGVSQPTARNYLKVLEEVNLVKIVRQSATDPTTYWAITDSPFWAGFEVT